VATLTPLAYYNGKSNINETVLEKTTKKPIPLTTTRLLKSIRLNVVSSGIPDYIQIFNDT
jgi:hypothetical protein